MASASVAGPSTASPPPAAARAFPSAACREAVHAWLLALPALVLLAAFTHWPVVATVLDSLWSTPRGRRPQHFVGLDTYGAMFADPAFRQAVWNQALYALGTIPPSIVLALLMALAVDGAAKGSGLGGHAGAAGRAALRLMYFTPTMLPLIAVANIWLFFYTPDYGLFDRFGALLGFGRHNWLGEPGTALPALMLVAVWKEAGFFMVFYLAALQAIPPALREAGALEGASRWHFFHRVTWPLLMPTTLFVAVNAVINAVRVVDHVVVMTRGGPDNASSLLLYYVYEQGFRFWDTSTAAAATTVLVLVLAAVAALQFGLMGRRVHYR